MDRSARPIDTDGGAVVHGNVRVARDFVGRDQHKHYYVSQVTPIFVPRPAVQESRQPYLGPRAFRAADHEILTGRGGEAGEVLAQIRDPSAPSTVVLGPPDVGKTSFMAAGILPRLNGAGAEVFPLRDYGDAVSLLKGLLLGQAVTMELDVSAEADVPELTQAVVDASSRRMVWVFDQFERFFLQEVSAGERDALAQTLDRVIQRLDPHRFQLMIGLRDDWQSALDRQWSDVLPGLMQSAVHLRALTRAQARVAILEPTRVLRVQPIFDEAFLDGQLLDDLDRLSLDHPESILPADLQVVCQHLHEAASVRQEQSIKAPLYFEVTEGKGAEWILDDHFRGMLDRVQGVGQDQVRAVVAEMLALEPGMWAAPDRLPVEGASRDEIASTLEAMARADLAVWHLTDGRRTYTFASNSIAKAAERALGQRAQKRLQARRELTYVWRDWVADDAWASRHQLTLLEEHYTKGAFPAERALVALRSAVTRHMAVRPWLERLDGEPGRRLIRDLEEGEAAGDERSGELTRRRQASRILGLLEEELSQRPASQAFGPLAWTAAVHREPESREAAALALLSAYDEEALKRVASAVEAARDADVLRDGPGRCRLAELRGMLADARDEVAEEVRGYEWRERLAVWWWRFRRRVSRDRGYLLGVPLGGALGAGLALGLLRFLMAPLLREEAGLLFYAYLPTGCLLGGAVSLGLVLVNALRLRPPEHQQKGAESRPPALAVLQGALCFTAAYLLLILLLRPSGLLSSPLSPVVALACGAGLSFAVRDQPMVGWRMGLIGWGQRLAVAALAFALGQGLFVAVDVALGRGRDLGTALNFIWSGYTYKSALLSLLERWGAEGEPAIGYWYHVPSVVDAAVVGLVLALGTSAGLIVAGRRHRQWTSLIRRSGE